MIRTTKGLIYTIGFLVIILMGSCSHRSRDNDKFISRMPSEFVEHYKFIDTYRTMYPEKLDSILKLFDNRYENDSSSIESAYYNLAFAYKEYSNRDYRRALSHLFHAENAITNREFPAFKAEIKLLAAMAYKNLEFNIFAKIHFKEAYNYFKEGNYPNQTMLAAFNLAWLANSDSLKGSSNRADSYIKQCDSIFINNHDKIEYVNYYHYKYLVDQSNTNYFNSILEDIDITVEPSININRLYHMNINLAIALNNKKEFDRARVVINRLDSIYNIEGDKIRPRLRSYHLFEEAIILAEEGHPKAAYKSYREGTEIREAILSDPRIEINRYRALYNIYYARGNKAQSDSVWSCYKNASDTIFARQHRDGAESLFRYKDLAMHRNEQILRVNRYHLYIRVILVIIGLISVGYIIYNIKRNRDMKRYEEEISIYEEDDSIYEEDGDND